MPKNAKTALTITAILLVVTVLSVIGVWLYHRDQVAQTEIAGLSGQLEEVQAELAGAQEDVDFLNAEMSDLWVDYSQTENQRQDAEGRVDELTLELAGLEARYITITQELAASQTGYRALAQSYAELETAAAEAISLHESAESALSAYICTDQLSNLEITSLDAVSGALMDWLAARPHVAAVHRTLPASIPTTVQNRLNATYWEGLWNDASSQVHTIHYQHAADGATYAEHFLIYFDERGWQPGIYWLSQQCWLAGGP